MSTTTTSTVSEAALRAELEALRAENAVLQAAKTSTFSLKVSEKGAVSVYGLGRFPVTLYREQMERFLDRAEEIRKFIAENASKLSVKQKTPPKV